MENEEVLENTPETLEQLVNEVNDYKDKYYRAVAETENIKKRVERDKTQAIKFANEKFLEIKEAYDYLIDLKS